MYKIKCVCVEHLNRCKTSFHGADSRICFYQWLLTVFVSFQQGATGSLHGCRQRSSMQLTRISRLITVTYLLFIHFLFGMGRGSTQEPPCRLFLIFYIELYWSNAPLPQSGIGTIPLHFIPNLSQNCAWDKLHENYYSFFDDSILIHSLSLCKFHFSTSIPVYIIFFHF